MTSLMDSILYINWNVNPEIVSFGSFSLRYYSLLFVGGLVVCALLLGSMIRKEGVSDENYAILLIYCLIGLVIGARLGHCLFYEPRYYLSHLTEMFLPIQKLPSGEWQFTGYHGLASHGGVLGLIAASALFARAKKVSFIKVVDLIAIVTPLAGFFIRLANLMNSEIVGRVTDLPWAFVFQRIDSMPRHPAQVYEAICYLLIFIINICLYKKWRPKLQFGFFFGLSAALICVARFFIEFLKEHQVDFESGMTLDMGQWLSIPFFIVGVFCIFNSLRRSRKIAA